MYKNFNGQISLITYEHLGIKIIETKLFVGMAINKWSENQEKFYIELTFKLLSKFFSNHQQSFPGSRFLKKQKI